MAGVATSKLTARGAERAIRRSVDLDENTEFIDALFRVGTAPRKCAIAHEKTLALCPLVASRVVGLRREAFGSRYASQRALFEQKFQGEDSEQDGTDYDLGPDCVRGARTAFCPHSSVRVRLDSRALAHRM